MDLTFYSLSAQRHLLVMKLKVLVKMSYKRRADTLRVVIGSHRLLVQSPRLNDIIGEVNRIAASSRVPRHNGWLLAVLHTTRALDTTLKEVLNGKGWMTTSRSLGGYLRAFRDRNALNASQTNHYQQVLVGRRNVYMHEAGRMPSQRDADEILSEMHACVVTILGRL